MKATKTLVLAIVAVALIAFLMTDRKKVEEQKKQEAQEKELLTVEGKDVMKVTVDRRGEKVVAERDGEGWKITEPIAWNGDKFAWDSIATNLASAEISRTLPDEGQTLSEEDLKNWGVNDPGLVLTSVIREASKELTFKFGKPVAGGTSFVYGTRSDKDGKVFVLPNAIITSASKDLKDLRDRKILDTKFEDITGVEIRNQDVNVVASKDAAGNWNMSAPMEARVDPAELRKFVDKLANNASDILDAPPADQLAALNLGPDQIGSATMFKVIKGTEGSSSSFHVGTFSPDQSGYVGKREGTDSLFVLPKEFFTGVPTSVDELRPKKIISLSTWNAEVISVTAEGKQLYALAKKEGSWHMTFPHDATAERTAIDGVLRSFDDNKVRKYVDSATQTGLDNPRLIFEVKGEGKSEVVKFGGDEGLFVFGGWEGTSDAFWVNNALYNAINVDPLTLLTLEEKARVSPSAPPSAIDILAATGEAVAPAPAVEEPPAQPAEIQVAPATTAIEPATASVETATK